MQKANPTDNSVNDSSLTLINSAWSSCDREWKINNLVNDKNKLNKRHENSQLNQRARKLSRSTANYAGKFGLE